MPVAGLAGAHRAIDAALGINDGTARVASTIISCA